MSTTTTANTAANDAARMKREARLKEIVEGGLPTLPSYVFELNTLLRDPAADLKKAANIIRTDPSLSAQLLRICNSALFGQRRKVLSISQAAVALGTERLRTLVLACSVMRLAGRHLPSSSVQVFWQHSLMAALLSERIALWMDYSEKEQAYLGGLLHDIGQLPLWMVAQEERGRGGVQPPAGWQDNSELEQAHFGMDHCHLGSELGRAWNFMPSFLEVFQHHHNPAGATHDAYLAGMVAAADYFCRTHERPAGAPAPQNPQPAATPEDHDAFLKICVPHIFDEDRAALWQMLEAEYPNLLPLIEYGMAS